MKRLIAFLLAIMMALTGCTQPTAQTQPSASGETMETVSDPTQSTNNGETTAPAIDESLFEDEDLYFDGLNDPALLQYTEDRASVTLDARSPRRLYSQSPGQDLLANQRWTVSTISSDWGV